MFSKEFNLLIIQEDKRIDLKQELIRNKKIILRDYLVGNEFDIELIKKLTDNNKLDEYLIKDKGFSFKGIERIEGHVLLTKFKKIENEKLSEWHSRYAYQNYLSKVKGLYYNTPYIYQPSEKIEAFRIKDVDGYINKSDVNKHNFQRIRSMPIFEGKKIIINRFGNKTKAAYSKRDLFFSNLIYGIKLQNEELYPFVTALLNSELIDHFLTQKYRRRDGVNMSNITTSAIRNVPIAKQLDGYILSEIIELSNNLIEGKLEYDGEVKILLNKLIFDLYELGFYERQRIKDFFVSDKIKLRNVDLEEYKRTLQDMFELYFTETPIIESYIDNVFGSGITVVAIYFTGAKNSIVSSKNILRYSISKEILKSSSKKFSILQNRIVGKDCVYLIKNSIYNNWSITKAYEDAKDIMNRGHIKLPPTKLLSDSCIERRKLSDDDWRNYVFFELYQFNFKIPDIFYIFALWENKS